MVFAMSSISPLPRFDAQPMARARLRLLRSRIARAAAGDGI